MTRRTAVTAAVPLLLAGLLAVPAAGTAARPTTAGDVQARGLALAAGGATVLAAHAGEVRRLDPDVRTALARPGTGAAGRAAAVARATEALTGRPVLLLPLQEEDVEPAPAPVGAFTFGVPAGDLDGDRLEDVVTYAFGPDDESARVQARRGTDGSVLWERPLDGEAGFVAPLGRDVTGDGRADLVLDTFSVVGDSVVTPVTSESRVHLRQVHGVVSGADGGDLWSRTLDGSVVERRTGTGTGTDEVAADARTVEVEATGLPLIALAGAGEGRPVLLENVVDITVRYRDGFAYTPVAAAFAYEEVVRSATRAGAVDPVTGAPRELRSADDVPGLALLLPAGDLDRDRSPDALWVVDRGSDSAAACAFALVLDTCRGTDGSSAPPSTTELLRTADGAALWSREDPGPALVGGLGADADGDGTDDLVRQQLSGGLEVVSGRDGRALWLTAAEEHRDLVALDRGTAVLLGVTYDFQGAEVVLERRDLATGAVRAVERRPVPGLLLAYAQELADGDGDGGREVVLGTLSGTSTAEGDVSQLSSTAEVLPVAGGPALLTTAGDDLRFLMGYPDLDGDGLAEVVLDVVTEVEDDPFGTTATALRPVDGTTLWQLRARFFALPHPGGDQDGRPGAELLASRLRGDDRVVDSLRGADLGLRWTAG